MSGRYVHNNGQYQQQTLGFDLDLTIQRYLHDAGYLTGHAGKFLHWLDLGVEAPYFNRWTHFKGGYENVYMNFDGTVRRSQATRPRSSSTGRSTTSTTSRAATTPDRSTSTWRRSPPHDPYVAEQKYATAAVPAHQPDPSYMEADRSDKPTFVRNQDPTGATVQATGRR